MFISKTVDVDDSAPSDGFDSCSYFIIGISYFLFLITFPISIFLSLKIANEYERAVILRLGRILTTDGKGPGLFFILPCVDSCVKVDLRTISFNVPPQEILTKDSVTIAVDAVCFYKILDPILAVKNVANAQSSTRSLTATTLRNILGMKTLHEILQEKEAIAQDMHEFLDNTTANWGIRVERVEVKDVRLPSNMQRAMATEAESTREARANVIAAEGEQKASFALKKAAEIIDKNPLALQLRYLQTLTTISAEKNSTIIFPIPIEFINKYPRQK